MKKIIFSLLLVIAVCFLFASCDSVANKNVCISEVMTNNENTYSDENGEYCDWIEIYNPTSEPVDLEGYMLTDDPLKVDKYFFPSIVIKAGGYLVIFADGKKTEDVENNIIHVPFSLSSKGESLLLFNNEKKLRCRLNIPELKKYESYGIDSDGKLRIFEAPTPCGANIAGDENAVEAAATQDVTGKLLINEYSTSSATTVMDEDGDFVSWVELYNFSKKTIKLNGYTLSDDIHNKKKWTFPDCKIEAGGYLVVYLSGKTKNSGDSKGIHCSFKLNGSEDGLWLYSKSGKKIDTCEVFDLFSNLTCGRPVDAPGTFSFFAKATPGKANNLQPFDSVDSARYTGNKEIAITEVAAVNTSVAVGSDDNYPDYIELYNTGKKDINLKNYKLSDSKDLESFKQLPNVTIKPGEYRAVYCGDSDYVSYYGNIYVSFGLNRYGETIYLMDKNNAVVDLYSYGRLFSGYSSGRDINSTDEIVYYQKLTPGEANPTTSLKSALPDPEFSQSSTYLEKGSSVSLSVKNGEIHYTLDGSVPSSKSLVYSEPITINKNTVIRAKTYLKGYVPSDTVSGTYIVTRKSDLPVIFLSSDRDNLFSYNSGILADGPNKSSEYPYLGANYWQDWERPVNFEYMSADGVSQVQFDAGIEVFGQFSRALPQKSLQISLKDKYGPKEVCYPFFDNNDVNVFSSLVLRDSGQDFTSAHIRDAFCAMVIKNQVDVDIMDYKPVVVYINGEYYGIYDLREKIDDDYIKNHQGIEKENLDLIKGNNIVASGNTDSYDKLIDYIKSHDMTNDKYYKYVCSKIDIDELISYWMCESFFTNTDTGNIRFYHDRTNSGKWRWIFFDVDWALYPTTYEKNYIENYIDPVGHGVGNNFSTTIMRNLVKNKDFRKRLLEINCKNLKTTFDTDRMLKIYDGLIDEISSEMPYHIERWSDTVSEKTWKNSVAQLRHIITKKRAIFIDDLIETFNMTDAEIEKYLGNSAK